MRGHGLNRVGFHCSRQGRGPPDPLRQSASPGGSLGGGHAPAVVSLVRLAVWRRSGSNRRPPACKAGALPAELRPRDLMQGSGQSPAPSPGSVSRPVRLPDMGQGGLEPPTPRLSSVCSNQLSYWPKPLPNPCQTFWRAASAGLPGPGCHKGPQAWKDARLAPWLRQGWPQPVPLVAGSDDRVCVRENIRRECATIVRTTRSRPHR